MIKLKPRELISLVFVFKLRYSLKGIIWCISESFFDLRDIVYVVFGHLRAAKDIVCGIFKNSYILRCIAVVAFLALGFTTTYLFAATPLSASAATNNTLNFQARLETAAGAIAPDGNYTISFHLFNAASAAGGTSTDTACGTDTTCEWTEEYTSGNALHVANGYLTVNLGSITAFPAINWDQQQYLTMDIYNSGTSSWDGQMSPRLPLTAVPYAFRAGALATGNGTYSSTLSLAQPASSSQSFVVADQGAAGTYDLLTGGTVSGATAGVVLQSSSPGTQQTGNFNISGTGLLGTLDATGSGSANTLTIGAGAAYTGSIAIDTSASVTSGTVTIGGANQTGTITVGQSSGGNNTINIGAVAGNTYTQIVNIGTSSTSGSKTAVTIGSTVGSSTTTIQGGTSGISLVSGSQTITVPNATGTICLTSQNCGTAGSGYILDQSSSPGTVQASSNFNISGTGIASTLEVSTSGALDTSSAGTLNIGTGNANAIHIGQSGVTTTNVGALTVSQLLTGSAGISTSGGAVSLQGNTNSSLTTTSGTLTLQGTGSTTLSTTNGTTSAGITIQTGNASAGNSGSIIIDVGTATGTTGTIGIGTSNASSITLGKSGTTTTFSGGVLYTPSSGFSSGTNSATVTASLLTNNAVVPITATASGLTFNMPTGIGSAGRVVYATNAGSNSFLLNIGPYTMTFTTSSTATLYWNGTAWSSAGLDAGVTAMGAVDAQGSPNVNGATIQNNTLYLDSADGTHPGVINATTQNIGGAKTFMALLTGSAGLTATGGAVTLTGNTNSSLTTTSGTLTLQGTGSTTLSTTNGTTSAGITIQTGNASSGTAGTVLIDTGTSSSGSGTINVGTANAGTVDIATNNVAHAIHIGDGGTSTAQTITIGSTGSTSATTIQGGTNGSALALQVGSGGTISVGTTVQTTTINVGNSSASTTLALLGGTTSTGAGALSLQAASGGLITVGTANGNPITLGGNTTIATGKTFTVTNGTSSLTGALTQTGGAVSLTGNAASSFSTSSGTLSLDSASTLSLGPTNATAIVLGGNTSATITEEVANSSATAFLLQTVAGVNYLTADSSNKQLIVAKGSAGETSGTAAIPLVLDSSDTAPTAMNGGMYYDTNTNSFRCGILGAWHSCTGLASTTTTTSGTITGTTTSYTAFNNQTGVYTPPLNDCSSGVVYQITASGWYDNNNSTTNNFTLALFIGTVQLTTAGTATNAQVASSLVYSWDFTATITCQGSNNIYMDGNAQFGGGSTGVNGFVSVSGRDNNGYQSIWPNTGTSQFQMKTEWASGSSSGAYVALGQFNVQRLTQ